MKQTSSGKNSLAIKIMELELLEKQQTEELKDSFNEFGESIKPAAIIKNAMRSVISSPGLRSTALDTAISSGAGLLGRKLLVRGSRNIFKKIAGTAFQFVVSNFVRNKMPDIKKNYSTNGVHNNDEDGLEN